MKQLLAPLLALTLVGPIQPQGLFSEIGPIEEGLASITGLAFTHHVPSAILNKEQLRHDLEQRVKESVKPADLRAQELTLKLLGLVPPDFDLRENTLDLLTEQAAAFYDYNKKKLFILEDTHHGAEEQVALVHEMAHALADQHFPLAKFIRDGQRSDDGSTARMAVMEGQASWLMAAYLAKQAGGTGELPASVLNLMTKSIESSAAEYPVFSQQPPYMRESLTFPYTGGMLFQNAVYEKLGRDAFTEVFLRPPVSTQQIFHPDLYLAHSAPSIPKLPPFPQERDFRKLGEGTLGELEYRVLLSQYLNDEEGRQSAAHLAGSSYALLEHKREKFPAIIFASTWDSEDAAAGYFNQYRRVLRGKWKTVDFQAEGPASIGGHGDTGYFRVWREGATVYHLEGWKSPLH